MEKSGSNNSQSSVASKGSGSSNGLDKGKQEAGSFGGRNRSGARRRETSIQKTAGERKPLGRDAKKGWTNGNEKKPGAKVRTPRPSGPSGALAADSLEDWYSDMSARDGLVPGMGSEFASKKLAPGSKKHNLNHLLNFTFTRRDPLSGLGYGPPSHRHGLKYPKYCKEQFIQANCQFVVRKGKEYGVHAADPDHPVDWDIVEDIRFNCLSNENVCPICLHPPSAAKITKCGHIYCWSCILHYLALSDQKWRKCPICYDAIYKNDLKSVATVNKTDFKVGDEITLRLMKRKKGSIIPISANDKALEVSFFNLEENEAFSSFHKLLMASPGQVLASIVARERLELHREMEADGDSPEACFIEAALELLKDRESFLRDAVLAEEQEVAYLLPGAQIDRENENIVEQMSTKSKATSHPSEQLNWFDLSPREAKFSAETIVAPVAVVPVKSHREDANAEARSSLIDQQKGYYYFYQSLDGQHIYLHSLNVKMLSKEYGSLEGCPTEITGKIVEMEWASMSDQLRKRLRYMQHLPLTCEFKVVELELLPPLVSPETGAFFQEELLKRQRARNQRAREERRRDRNIRVEENKRINGIYPSSKYRLTSEAQFPVFCADEANENRPHTPSDRSEASSTCGDLDGIPVTIRPRDIKDDISCCSGTSPPTIENEFSFAKMLREGKLKAAPVAAQGVAAAPGLESEDGSKAKSQHQYSLSDAFEAALNMRTGSSGKGKKKKKGKQNKSSLE